MAHHRKPCMAYQIHHLNCATLCPGSRRLINGEGGYLNKAKLVCHCLLIETNDGLVLIDTGFGFDDITSNRWVDKLTQMALGSVRNPDECAISQIRKLGYNEKEVTHIILTHLDVDHAGGIKDFPNAQVHIYEKELIAARDPKSIWERTRYDSKHWAHEPKWKTHRYQGERWQGFESVQVLSDSLYDILLVPLVGHSRGHCGVAVSTTEGWLLHCGDAYFHRNEVQLKNRQCPIGLELIQGLDDCSRAERLYNQSQLAAVNQDPTSDIQIFCSHDHVEFDECCQQNHILGKPSVDLAQ